MTIKVGQIYRYNHDDDPSYIYGVIRVGNGVPHDAPSITLYDLQEDESVLLSVDHITDRMTLLMEVNA